jgi:histidyl-tRNA synthetase
VFKEMAIGEFRIRINNRKVLKGLLQAFQVPEEASSPVLRILDKVEKEEQAQIRRELLEQGLSDQAAGSLYDLIAVKRSTSETFHALATVTGGEALQTGVAELRKVADGMRQFGVPDSAFAVDLGVVRGLDYYTGTIYETSLVSHPELGSICSGGRYDDLASYFTNTRLPGVGISIGLTRLFSGLREAGLVKDVGRTPAEAIVIAMDERYISRYLEIGRKLRAAGVNTEVYLEAAKLSKQMTYADRKGFRVAVIAGENEFRDNVVQIKDLGRQEPSVHPMDQVVEVVKSKLSPYQ